MKRNGFYLMIAYAMIISLKGVICKLPIESLCEKSTDSVLTGLKKLPLIGKGSYGSIHALSNELCYKIIELQNVTKEKINEVSEEIAFLKFINTKRKIGIKGVNYKDNFDPYSAVVKIEHCWYTLGKKTGNQYKKVQIVMQLERMRYPFMKIDKLIVKWKVPYIAEIMKKLLYGLKVLHLWGYSHNDIKPENIMMRNAFEPVIIDYGFVLKITNNKKQLINLSSANDYVRLSLLKGTPIYMSPELVQLGHYSFKSDVYALGVLLLNLFNSSIDLYNVYDGNRYGTDLEILLFKHRQKGIDYDDAWPFLTYSFEGEWFFDTIHSMVTNNPKERLDVSTCIEQMNERVLFFYKHCDEFAPAKYPKYCISKLDYQNNRENIDRWIQAYKVMVRTPGFQPGNRSSILRRGTTQ